MSNGDKVYMNSKTELVIWKLQVVQSTDFSSCEHEKRWTIKDVSEA
jgi:hypothetical protein